MKLFFWSCILLVASITARAQSIDEQNIRLLLSEQAKAWNMGDLKGYMKGYWKNDTLMFIGKSGATYGWDNILSNYQKSYPDVKAMGQLKFELLSVQLLCSNYAQVAGKWYLAREQGDVKGHFTLLLRKIGDQWQIITDHSS